jgi:hypothetical protein
MKSKIKTDYDLFVDTFWFKLWKICYNFYSDNERAFIQNGLYYINRTEVLDAIEETLNTK